jgi:surface antigen
MKNKLRLSIITAGVMSVAGCATLSPEATKTLGQLGGAAAGAVLGSTIGEGKGKIVATALGAAIGAWIGNEIANALTAREKEELESKTITILENTPDNRTVIWDAPETGKVVKITPKTVNKDIEVSIKKIDDMESPSGKIKLFTREFEAKKNLNILSQPDKSGDIIGSYRRGERIHVAAETEDKKWYIIEKKGIMIGYVESKNLADIKQSQSKPKTTQPNSSGPATAQAQPKMRKGIDLDALEAEAEAVKVAAVQECRTVTYNMDTNTHTSPPRCKGPDGEWKA